MGRIEGGHSREKDKPNGGCRHSSLAKGKKRKLSHKALLLEKQQLPFPWPCCDGDSHPTTLPFRAPDSNPLSSIPPHSEANINQDCEPYWVLEKCHHIALTTIHRRPLPLHTTLRARDLLALGAPFWHACRKRHILSLGPSSSGCSFFRQC
jgi:hypothetical protein